MLQVWHNYGFDMHILQRRCLGIDEAAVRAAGGDPAAATLNLGGFAGDTLHLARLHDAGRKGTRTYSLASLSGDPAVMAADLTAGSGSGGAAGGGGGGGAAAARAKVSMKELFAKPKIMKGGKASASLKELPPIHEIQARRRYTNLHHAC